MKRPIVTDPIYLKNVSTDAQADEIAPILQDLNDSLDIKRGIGLAGVQIGILKRIAIIRIGDQKINLINAYIVEKNNKFRMRGEGCLSIPDLHVDTTRYNDIKINNNGIIEEYTGLLAVAIQHEIAHFFGKTILDYKWKAR